MKKVLIIIIVIAIISSCKRSIEIGSPVDRITGRELYKNDAGAATVLTGIYSDMVTNSFVKGRNSMPVAMELSSDELTLDPSSTDILLSLYTNSLTNTEPGIWQQAYSFIFRVNAAIEGIMGSTGLSNDGKNQLLGEAKFLRGFFYFYLVNLYGDVPLVTTSDLNKNLGIGRMDKKEVYDHIILDLTEAKQLLKDNYLAANIISTSPDRLRPNKNVARALLARVFLYKGDYLNAERNSDTVIEDKVNYNLEPNLKNVFIKKSKETIWALQPTTSFGLDKTEAGFFVLTSGYNYSQPVSLSKLLYNSFLETDNRRNAWIGSFQKNNDTLYFSNKYSDINDGANISEFITVLRLSEQYLIRAEARAQQGRILGIASAEEDLNIIRIRAGLTNTKAISKSEILAAIFAERKFELFMEWGHRWLDLKRTGNVDSIMTIVTPLKGGVWQPYKALYPIPIQDIQRDPSLKGHQNPGYPEI